jgi:hypothetical protein
MFEEATIENQLAADFRVALIGVEATLGTGLEQ